jgi:hypothetical protein
LTRQAQLSTMNGDNRYDKQKLTVEYSDD